MRRLLATVLTLLAPAALLAQTLTFPALSTNNAFTGTNSFSPQVTGVALSVTGDASSSDLADFLTNAGSNIFSIHANGFPGITGCAGGSYLKADWTGCGTPSGGSGTVTSVTAGTGLNGGTITTSGTISLANTTVTPNSYTNANITVNQQGQITAASNGSGGGGGDTITSPNSTLNVGGSSSNTTLDLAGSAGEIMAGATPALTYTPTLGKSGTAGTLSLFPASGNFTTTLGSAATASNTVNFFAAVPTNLHMAYCAVTSTTCTFTDTGYAYNSIPNADLANSAITIAGTSVSLGGSTSSFPTPGAIGGTTPAAGTFTTLAANTSLTVGGGSATLGASGTAGTLAMYPASGNFTTTLSTGATASNTVKFFASVIANNDLFYCVVSSTTCTLTDAGYAFNALPLADFATQTANTFVANVSGSTAAPTAASLPSCSTAYSALQYTSGTGLGCSTVEVINNNTNTGTSAMTLNLSASTTAPSVQLPAVVGGTILSGTSTANLSAPAVILNTNSSNNNTSITLGISSPGTSTGQTTLNVNCAATGGDCTDWGNGGTWTNGVLSGQTIVSSILSNGSFQAKGATAGFFAVSQGSTSASVAPCNSANTICFQAPTSVTSQLRVLAGAPATGIPLYTNSSGTMTETITATSGTLTSGVGTWGNNAINTVLASTVANVAGHFTNLQAVTSLFNTCTTAPIFNVFDGTSNTGSTVTAAGSTQTKGTGTSTAQTLTFAAGDIIGIYISAAGGTCTTDLYTVTAQYSIP